MKNRKRLWARLFIGTILGLLLVTGAVAAPPPEQESKGQDLDQPVSSGPISKTETKVWTNEEMVSAIPYPMSELKETGADLAAEPLVGPVGPLEIIPGGLPEESKQQSLEAADVLEADYQEGLSLLEIEPLGYSYPYPFTRFEIFTSYTQYPYSTIGKVFFRQGGDSFVCSGAVAVGRAVWTAGHCVHSGGGNGEWSSNVVFVPAYKDRNAPYGQWTAKQLFSLKGWTRKGRRAYDIGMIVTNDNSDGEKISQVTGWLGAMWNASRRQHWNDFGYPAADPFDGKRLIVCQASHARNDSVPGPDQIGIGCDMTGGSSGGPWIVKFDGRAGPYNYANGVNSWKYDAQPDAIYGPYFGKGAKNLYNTVKDK